MTLVNPYASDAELGAYLKGLQITPDEPSIHDAMNTSFREIDVACGRRFFADTSATSRTFEVRDWREVGIDDCYEITSVKLDLDDDGVYETTLTPGTHYRTLPRNGVCNGIEGFPATAIQALRSTRLPVYNYGDAMQVTGKWGWAAVPVTIKSVSLRVTGALLKYRDAPGGIAGDNAFGIVRMPKSELFYVQTALLPYAKLGGTLLGAFA